MTTFDVSAGVTLHEGGVGDRDLRIRVAGGGAAIIVAHLAVDTPIGPAQAQAVFSAWLDRGCGQLTPRDVDRLLVAGGSRHG